MDCKDIKIRKSVFVSSNLLYMISSFLLFYLSTFVLLLRLSRPTFVLVPCLSCPKFVLSHVCLYICPVLRISVPLLFKSSYVCPTFVLFCLIVLGDYHDLAAEMKRIVDQHFISEDCIFFSLKNKINNHHMSLSYINSTQIVIIKLL